MWNSASGSGGDLLDDLLTPSVCELLRNIMRFFNNCFLLKLILCIRVSFHVPFLSSSYTFIFLLSIISLVVRQVDRWAPRRTINNSCINSSSSNSSNSNSSTSKCSCGRLRLHHPPLHRPPRPTISMSHLQRWRRPQRALSAAAVHCRRMQVAQSTMSAANRQ